MVQTTWHGAVQNASRTASSLLLIATSLVIAGWFAAEGRRGWAWFYGAAIPMVFVALTVVGLAIGGNPAALAFLATPWIWVTALAVYFYRREAQRRTNEFHTEARRHGEDIGPETLLAARHQFHRP